MAHPVLLRPECVKAADGDIVVGLLLSQIVYWYLPSKAGKSKLTKARYGSLWIAKSRERWMAETGLTPQQYRRAISVLKRKGLVEVKQMVFANKTISHLRLLKPFEGIIWNAPYPVGGNTPPERGETPHRDRSIDNTRSEKEYDLPCNCESRYQVDSQRGDVHPEEEPGGKEREKEDKETEVKSGKDHYSARLSRLVLSPPPKHAGWLMKATDILKHTVGPSNGSLEGWWKSRMALIDPGFQKALTQKERGQLKHLSKLLEERTRPVITYAIEHWCKFSSVAGAAAGVPCPQEPHIGFLVQHHAVAVNLLYPQKTHPSVTAQPVEDCTQVQHPPPVPVEDVHVISSQELTELLAGLKSP